MKTSTKIIIAVVACLVLVATAVAVFTIFPPKTEEDKLEDNLSETLKTIAVDCYENEFKKLMPTILDTNGFLTITLDYLQGINKDISFFEEHSCDLNNTFVKIIKDGDGYKTEVSLDCKLD